eukprot:6362939-Amphidinium_carterae.1
MEVAMCARLSPRELQDELSSIAAMGVDRHFVLLQLTHGVNCNTHIPHPIEEAVVVTEQLAVVLNDSAQRTICISHTAGSMKTASAYRAYIVGLLHFCVGVCLIEDIDGFRDRAHCGLLHVRRRRRPMTELRRGRDSCQVRYSDGTVIQINYTRLGLSETEERVPTVIVSPDEIPEIGHLI